MRLQTIKTVCNLTPAAFDAAVNGLLAEGWCRLGDPSILSNVYGDVEYIQILARINEDAPLPETALSCPSVVLMK